MEKKQEKQEELPDYELVFDDQYQNDLGGANGAGDDKQGA